METLMHLIMFDIDGTLVNSSKFDEECYIQTAKDLFGVDIPADVNEYTHVTDTGILDDIVKWFEIPGDREQIRQNFVKSFNKRISDYINTNPDKAGEVPGASEFIRYLKNLDNVKIALATGGWEETARLKLDNAGIDVKGLPLASSNDHYIRTEIMKLAESQAQDSVQFQSKIYFGDAAWDLEASAQLGYRFILVGDRIEYGTRIHDYLDIEKIMDNLAL